MRKDKPGMVKEYANTHKPKLPFWILRFIADEFHNLSAIGDLEELYSDKVIRQGWFMASLWLWRQVLRSVTYFFIHSLILSLVMINNYIKIALRNIKRQKGYSFINIFGLAALVIALFTVSFHSTKAARANPVEALKYE